MYTNSSYTDGVISELMRLPPSAIKRIHDSGAIGISLPRLAISDEIIYKLRDKLNEGFAYPERGFYKPYIEQTITRYAQRRLFWKDEFGLS